MMRRLLLLSGISLLLLSCTSDRDASVETIRFWHFWSEPSQRKALEDIVRNYEREHPNVHVELSTVQWADGKSKLHLAFNAGTQPDVLHLGSDWLAEFAEAGVLAPIPDSLRGDLGLEFAARWTRNARALVEWTGPSPRYQWGLCATDAHNVLKRTLPMLWAFGALTFMTRLPMQQDMNDTLVLALDSLRRRAQHQALIERSRDLDERFLRGEVKYLYTGSWIIDMARQRGITSFIVHPTPSILNGDVLCVSKKAQDRDRANAFVAYLTAHAQSARLCAAVSDAGFPSARNGEKDTMGMDAWRQGFLATVNMSKPIASSARSLDAEPVIEDMIVRCYDATSIDDVRRIVREARSRLQ
jgi:maltose-binding protein MalE